MHTIDCIIGIDPGSNGAVATWRPNAITTTIDMPEHIFDLRTYFQHIKTVATNPLVIMEKVQNRPDDMDFKKAVGIQKMLNGFQQLKDVLLVEDIPYVLVHPQTWQSTLYLKMRNENPEQVQEKVDASVARFLEKHHRQPGPMQLAELTDRATKSVRKDRYKKAAAQYYPEVKATLSNADALLLMHFGRVKLQNDPAWLDERMPPALQGRMSL